MRIEHSRFIKSIDEERKFLIEGEGDKCDLIRDIININAESFVRPIPFSDVWNTYWENINHHLFMFNEQKAAIAYFYDNETYKFIGPTMNIQSSFNR